MIHPNAMQRLVAQTEIRRLRESAANLARSGFYLHSDRVARLAREVEHAINRPKAGEVRNVG